MLVWQLMPDVGSALLFSTWLLQSSRLASSHCGLKEIFQEAGDEGLQSFRDLYNVASTTFYESKQVTEQLTVKGWRSSPYDDRSCEEFVTTLIYSEIS